MVTRQHWLLGTLFQDNPQQLSIEGKALKSIEGEAFQLLLFQTSYPMKSVWLLGFVYNVIYYLRVLYVWNLDNEYLT